MVKTCICIHKYTQGCRRREEEEEEDEDEEELS